MNEKFHYSNIDKSKNTENNALLLYEMTEYGGLSDSSVSTELALDSVLRSIDGSVESRIARTSHSTVYCVRSGLFVISINFLSLTGLNNAFIICNQSSIYSLRILEIAFWITQNLSIKVIIWNWLIDKSYSNPCVKWIVWVR